MTKEIDQKQIFEIIEKLPAEVKRILFSGETSDSIYNICKKYEVASEKISQVAKYTGKILFGILPREKLSETLKDEVGLSQKTADSVADEIGLSIFSQLGLSRPTAIEPTAEQPKKPSSQDVYREQAV